MKLKFRNDGDVFMQENQYILSGYPEIPSEVKIAKALDTHLRG